MSKYVLIMIFVIQFWQQKKKTCVARSANHMDETKDTKRHEETEEHIETNASEAESMPSAADQAESNASEAVGDVSASSVPEGNKEAENTTQTQRHASESVYSTPAPPVFQARNETISSAQAQTSKEKPKSSKSKFIIAGVLAVLVVIGAAFGIVYANKLKAEKISKQYERDLRSITKLILNSGARAEKCNNLIIKVWNNSIWQVNDPTTNPYTVSNGRFHSDFNDSLQKLFMDTTFMDEQEKIRSEKDQINEYMKKLKDPPEEWDDAYYDLEKCYDDYRTLINLALNPTGSLNTFSTAFTQADQLLIQSYDKVKEHLD